jgi:hypothetical protein
MAITLNGTGSISGLTSGAGIAATALSGQVPDANAPSGSVIQVVHGVLTGQVVFSNTDGPIGLSATITPSSTSNKILGFIHLDGVTVTSDNSYGAFKVFKNSAELRVFGYPRGWNSSDNASGTTMSCSFLDTPNTTSSLTYSVNWVQYYLVSDIQLNRDTTGNCTFTLMEVTA